MKAIQDIDAIDNVMIEMDYPHTDSTWPNSLSSALEQVAGLIAEGTADGSIPATVNVDAAARRLAACVDEWGRETLIGMRTPAGMRAALAAATAHELGPVRRARGRAA